MQFTPLLIEGVFRIAPKAHGDARGFFMETYRRDQFAAHGITADFIQLNHSRSIGRTLRGLHYQVGQPQAKLVRVIRGRVYDVVVDIRFGSPTFGRWLGEELTEDNKVQLFVPIGCAHGFCVLSAEAEFIYACSAYYHPAGERGIIWNDPDLNIIWPVKDPLLSAKDQQNVRFKTIAKDFLYHPGDTHGT